MLGYFLSGPIPHQIILSHWYKKRRGRAMGIAYVGGALLGALGNLLNPWLVTFLPYTRALADLRLRAAARVAGRDLRAARPARGCRTDP